MATTKVSTKLLETVGVAEGGTGATSASAARTSLGLVIGTNVLAPGGDGSSLTGISSGIEWQSVVTASTLTAVAGNAYPINTTSNACTVTLPAAATVGDTIKFVDYARKWGTNAVTITSTLNFQGNTTAAVVDIVYNTEGQSVTIVYVDVTQGWIPTVDDDTTHETVVPPYDAYYLVIGGGGAGANNQYHGGGGGAGGFRTNQGGTAYSIQPGVVYTCTVGAGGTIPTPGGSNPHYSGADSSLTGSDITNITSTGGGRGDNRNGRYEPAEDGGSGGGAGAYNTYSPGSGNTPSTTPSQGNDGGPGTSSSSSGGGGGGIGGAGTSSSGGAGTANTITGSSVTYAGGGGGGRYPSGTTTGGSGGGGAGSHANGSPGTDGLGGGGGSSERNGSAAAGIGGDGIVILRVPTADYSGTTTGSPTITTTGSDTVIKFTGTGTYTA